MTETAPDCAVEGTAATTCVLLQLVIVVCQMFPNATSPFVGPKLVPVIVTCCPATTVVGAILVITGAAAASLARQKNRMKKKAKRESLARCKAHQLFPGFSR